MTINLSEGLFNGCPALENVFIAEGNPNYKSVDGVVYDIAQTILYCYPAAKDPSAHKLPNTLITIADYAFHSFQSAAIELPESLETIGIRAFADSLLDSIHIPKNVISIGDYAFYNNISDDNWLKTLTFAEDSKLETISKYAFYRNVGLKKVVLPDSVTAIGTLAFNGCTELEEVVLSAGLTKLENSTFAQCPAIRNFTMQEGLKTIANYVMDSYPYVNQAMTELVFPATVTSIDSEAFHSLQVLKKLSFGENSQLETLGAEAFKDCSSLESLTLPAKLKSFGGSSVTWKEGTMQYKFTSRPVFAGCTSLKFVDMSSCEKVTTMPAELFRDCISIETLLLPPNLKTISALAFGSRTGYAGLTGLKEITIPAYVTSIGGYAFNGCTSLETVTFAEGSRLTELGIPETASKDFVTGTNIFAGTTNLKKVILPENLTLIGAGCFDGSGVAEMDIPSSVTTIGQRAFRNCANMQKAALSANLTYLGDEAFYGCEKLEEANLFFGLEYLGAQAFAYSGLKHAYIPTTVASISGNPFAGCTAIETFTLDPDSVDFKMVDGVLYDSAMFSLICYPANLTAETFEIPATVYELADGAFAGAKLKSMVIPERLTELPASIFQRSALESITFHRGLTTLGNYAFEGCENLNNVTLLNSITKLGNYVFANCTGLDHFVFEEVPENGAPYVFGTHFFDGCTAMTELILPNAMKLSSTVEHGIADTSGQSDLTKAIPAYMYANTGLVSVLLPERIVNIASEGVFYGCKQMETFVFEATELDCGYQPIGAYYFYGCSKLKELEILSGRVSSSFAGEYAFAYCTSLEKIIIQNPANYSLSSNCFEDCSSLKSIESAGFNQITGSIFNGLSAMKHIHLSKESMILFGVDIFAGSGIETVAITGLMRTWDAAFANAENLKNVWIGTASNLILEDTTFTNLKDDVNFYFYDLTYDEVVAKVGNSNWFKNADEKAHFYFKDTIPAGTEIPEDVQNDMK